MTPADFYQDAARLRRWMQQQRPAPNCERHPSTPAAYRRDDGTPYCPRDVREAVEHAHRVVHDREHLTAPRSGCPLCEPGLTVADIERRTGLS